MFRWYVINTYSGHENKVKQNLEHRVSSLNQARAVRQVVVPTETVQEMKDNQKVTVEKRTMPGYVLVNMDLNEDSWQVVKGTPGVTGFCTARSRSRGRRGPSSRSGSPSRSSPARCRTSPARSPRSTRTRAS
jgi:transcription antitermination factor NusG